jgi:hypothetical protein
MSILEQTTAGYDVRTYRNTTEMINLSRICSGYYW